MNVSAEDREAVRLALLSAYVVEAQLPADMIHLLDHMTQAPAPRRRRLFRR